ncbi:MAG: M42 family peptidase [Clostridia bacterium]|nr:M42 family peptidase [Clostridia bacterium]
MRLIEYIEKLSCHNAVSGHEHKVSLYLKKELESLLYEVNIDNLGNVIACKKSKNSCGSVMLEAHMDEIGLMVKKISEGGFLEVVPVGGIDPRILPGNSIVIHTNNKDYSGVIGAKPPHMMSAEEYEQVIGFDKLFIDAGFDYDFARDNVPLGSVVTFDSEFISLKGNQLCSKCMDDRASVAVLLDVAAKLSKIELNYDLYICICVQEEVGLRGSGVAAYSVNPDFAIAIDVTHAKTPDDSKPEFKCGSGIAVCKGPNIHPDLVKSFINHLDKHEIPYDTEIEGGNTGTDAWAIQIAREGIPVMLLSLPLKYMHTPVETLSLLDCESLSNALESYLKSFKRTEDVLCF